MGRVAIVTGGSIGIGRAISMAFDLTGDSVVVLDIDEVSGEKTAAELQRGEFIRCDVTDHSAVLSAVETIDDRHGQIDVLVNNAGGFPAQLTTEETDLEAWSRTLDLNLTSVFLVTKAALPLLRKSESGRIINIGSLAGQLASYRTAPAYSAAKAGVHALTRVLANELAADNITVNAVAPSAVLTDRIKELRDEEERAATAASIPLGRYQTPEELAAWVVFLASQEAGFMTGQTLPVNGGRFMS